MLGFTAHALTTDVELHDEELEDARWFTRAELAAGAVILPPRQSISFSLIEHWFDAGTLGRLREIPAAKAPMQAPAPVGQQAR
jgi:NAD+ diphosphatase